MSPARNRKEKKGKEERRKNPREKFKWNLGNKEKYRFFKLREENDTLPY